MTLDRFLMSLALNYSLDSLPLGSSLNSFSLLAFHARLPMLEIPKIMRTSQNLEGYLYVVTFIFICIYCEIPLKKTTRV